MKYGKQGDNFSYRWEMTVTSPFGYKSLTVYRYINGVFMAGSKNSDGLESYFEDIWDVEKHYLNMGMAYTINAIRVS